MARAFRSNGIRHGVMAGIISGLAGLVFAYLAGVLAIGFTSRDIFATLLAAATVLPLMLIIVFTLPSVLIGVLIGLLLGAVSNFSRHHVGLVAGAIIGLLCGEAVLSFVVPLILRPQSGDFISIISNRYLSAGYGLFLGLLTSSIFQRINRPDTKL